MHEKDDGEILRNPSPPPDISPGDNIGTTVFSQHWLFQQLMDVLKYVDVSGANNDDSDALVELDKSIEDSMCLLWDMSVELEVANFLMEFKAKDIFMEILVKTNAPRLQEIILGILGNMASHQEICDHFTNDNDFMICILHTLASTDTSSLIQTIRFLNACAVNETSGNKLIRLIVELENCLDSLKFILFSSLNVDLLKSTLKLLYECMDKEDNLILKLISEEYAKAIMDAGHQIVLSKNFEALDEFWHVVQLITTFSETCKILDIFREKLISYVMEYFMDLKLVDSMTPAENRLPAITAVFATVNALFQVATPDKFKDFESIKNSPMMDFINNLKENLSGNLRNDDDRETSGSIVLEVLSQIDELINRLNTATI